MSTELVPSSTVRKSGGVGKAWAMRSAVRRTRSTGNEVSAAQHSKPEDLTMVGVMRGIVAGHCIPHDLFRCSDDCLLVGGVVRHDLQRQGALMIVCTASSDSRILTLVCGRIRMSVGARRARRGGGARITWGAPTPDARLEASEPNDDRPPTARPPASGLACLRFRPHAHRLGGGRRLGQRVR